MKIQRILVATDFSETAERAVRYAAALAAPLKSELILVHVIEPIVLPLEVYGASGTASVVEAVDRSARESLAGAVAALKKIHRGRCRGVVVDGAPAWAIVDAADKLRIDLIVMGTHGRGGLSHLLLGSVAEKVVRSASCSVLTVGPEKRTRAARARRG